MSTTTMETTKNPKVIARMLRTRMIGGIEGSHHRGEGEGCVLNTSKGRNKDVLTKGRNTLAYTQDRAPSIRVRKTLLGLVCERPT